MSDEALEGKGKGAAGAEVQEIVEDGCALLTNDLADQSVDYSVAEGPAVVVVAEEISSDQELLFIVCSVEVGEGTIRQFETDGFAALSDGASISHVAVDTAGVEESDKQLDDITIVSRYWDARASAIDISSKDD